VSCVSKETHCISSRVSLFGGTLLKETDGAAPSYCCSKSNYGRGILSFEINVTIDMQVEAPSS
jgi:hypothetical protein